MYGCYLEIDGSRMAVFEGLEDVVSVLSGICIKMMINKKMVTSLSGTHFCMPSINLIRGAPASRINKSYIYILL